MSRPKRPVTLGKKSPQRSGGPTRGYFMVWLCLGYVAVTSPHINMIIGCVVRVNSQRRWAAQTLRSRRQILRRERARRVRPAAARILRRARDPPLAEALLRSCGPGLRLVDHLDHGGDVVYRHVCKLGSEARGQGADWPAIGARGERRAKWAGARVGWSRPAADDDARAWSRPTCTGI
jgi:hypothetical protein